MTKLTLDNEKQIFFYEQDFYVLSNFSSFSINFHSFDFPTAEHLYHYLKFDYNTNNDNDLRSKCSKIRNSIASAKSAHDAFKIAQECKEFRNPDWDNIKFCKMLEVLRLKVEQHEYVKKKLLETGDRELIENSWRDDVWGWGENRTGLNALGKLWMLVRQEIKLLDSLNNPNKEGYVVTPDGKSIYRKGVINPVQNCYLSKELVLEFPVFFENQEQFNFLISNLKIGDEIRKRNIKQDNVIHNYKILKVQEFYKREDKNHILFMKFKEDASNNFEGYIELLNDPENIKNFLNKFIEKDYSIAIFRD